MALSPSQYIRDSSRDFSLYVCSTRAIPLVCDGFKQGQRIVMWLLRHREEKLKTYALAGLAGYEKLYVHGESSCNDAIGKLAAPYLNNVPLIEGLGQFGSRVAPVEGIGAPRYTDVRRAKAAEALVYCDLDIVPLEDNYDGSNQQPVHFLPLIPLALLNGISGVAVGWSTEILPRSLKALIEATRNALLDRPIDKLIPHYQRYNVRVEATGKANQWLITGRAEVLDSSTVRISELPPGIGIERFRGQLIDMEDKGLIQTFTDRSTDNIDITIKMKRGSIADWSEDDAIKTFKLSERTTERIVVLDWQGARIRVYDTAEEVVRDFAAWRLAWFTKRYDKRLADARYEVQYWRALDELFAQDFGKQLGHFRDRAAVEATVQQIVTPRLGQGLDERQLDRVVGLATYRWTADYHGDVQAQIANLDGHIAEYCAILASPDRLRAIFVAELDGLKKLTL